MNHAASITVAGALDLLDGSFATFADGLHAQQYVLWVGAGISRDRVPDLGQLVVRVLEHLRLRANSEGHDGPFTTALERCLAFADLGALEADHVDFAAPVDEWEIRDDLVRRLTNRYAQFLNVQVEGEAPDYLLWDALEVIPTYAPNAPDPDCEHLCLAVLILEGAVTNIVSANWDGLVEAAVADLAGTSAGHALAVCVRSEDLGGPATLCTLYKIHGCAVLARDDPTTYRRLLVARSRQITGWTGSYWNDAAKGRLADLAATKRTLMVGLSAQDSNIQWLFVQAAERTQWVWPTDPPSHVFAEEKIGDSQRTILELSYATTYDAHHVALEEAALLRAYAKPLLVALVLDLIEAKFAEAIRLVPSSLNASSRDALKSGVRHLRNVVAQHADVDRTAFVRLVIAHTYRIGCLLRDGQPSSPVGGTYRPLTSGAVTDLAHDQDLAASGFLEFAAALAAIGVAQSEGRWRVDVGDLSTPASGALRLSSASTARVFFAASGFAAAALFSEMIDPADCADVVVIHSGTPPARQPRSPAGSFGRTGNPGPSEFGMRELLDLCGDSDELVRRLQEAVGI